MTCILSLVCDYAWYEDGRRDEVLYEKGLRRKSLEYGREGNLQCSRKYVDGVEVQRCSYDSQGKFETRTVIEYRIPGEKRLRCTVYRDGQAHEIFNYGPDGKMVSISRLRDGQWIERAVGKPE